MTVTLGLILISLIGLLLATGLVYLAFLVRGLRDQSAPWDQERDQALRQAEQVERETGRLAVELGERYGAYGEPYASRLRHAQASLERATAEARRALQERESPPAAQLQECPWWGIFLGFPLIQERSSRLLWHLQAQAAGDSASAGQRALDEARGLASALAGLGRQKQQEVRSLLARAEDLSDQLSTETRPSVRLDAEQTRLEGVIASLGRILGDFLESAKPLEADVVAAHAHLSQVEPDLQAVADSLQSVAARRGKAERAAHAVVQALHSLEADVQAEEAAARPLESLRAPLEAFRLRLQRLESALQAGDYDQVEGEGSELLADMQTRRENLRQLLAERRKFLAAYESAASALKSLGGELSSVPERYALDVTVPLYQAASARLPAMQRLARSENLEELRQAQPVSLAEALSAWQAFSERRRAFEASAPQLAAAISPLIPRLGAAIDHLRGRHARYQAGLDLSALSADREILRAEWAALVADLGADILVPMPSGLAAPRPESVAVGRGNGSSRPEPAQTPALAERVIAESALAELVARLAALQSSCERADQACARAEQLWGKLQSELAQARQAAEARPLVEYAECLRTVVAQAPDSLADEAQARLAELAQLAPALSAPASDYASLAEKANQLRGKLEAIDRRYREQLEKTSAHHRKLSDALLVLQRELIQMQESSGMNYKGFVEQPVQDVQAWLEAADRLPPEAWRDLEASNQAGETLRAAVRQAREEAIRQRRHFDQALDGAERAIEAARRALASAEQVTRQARWSSPTLNQNQLWQARELLRKSERVYEKVTRAQQEFTLDQAVEALEKAVIAESGRARQFAEEVQGRVAAQDGEIERLKEDLEAKVTQVSRQLSGVTDLKTRDAWLSIHRDLSGLERQLQTAASYEETRRLLARALQRVQGFLDGLA